MRITVKPKILVVEDQPEVLTTMTLLLERAGFEVFGAQTGMDGIRLSQKEEFDLVILDVHLPEKNGFEVCAWLKQDFRFSRTPIIFASGHWNEENRRRALELGAADFIDKPFDTSFFLQKIFSHLKTARRKN
ncbi:MAG: response regulator [Verrucomicrobiota bacterium]|jgi:DNA-binding response OmpR family regulator